MAPYRPHAEPVGRMVRGFSSSSRRRSGFNSLTVQINMSARQAGVQRGGGGDGVEAGRRWRGPWMALLKEDPSWRRGSSRRRGGGVRGRTK